MLYQTFLVRNSTLMTAEDAKKVLFWLESYQEQQGKAGVEPAAFGEWLSNQEAENQDNPELPPNNDGLISMYFGFMANYAAFYARRIFRQLDLYSLTDWAFLATLRQEEPMTKSALIKRNILEKSTGTEVLKRLKSQGFIEEMPNPEDRRVKWVQLSEKGREMIAEANAFILPMGNVIAGDLTPVEKQELLKLLQKLHLFHEPIFGDADEGELNQLLGLNQ